MKEFCPGCGASLNEEHGPYCLHAMLRDRHPPQPKRKLSMRFLRWLARFAAQLLIWGVAMDQTKAPRETPMSRAILDAYERGIHHGQRSQDKAVGDAHARGFTEGWNAHVDRGGGTIIVGRGQKPRG